MDLLMPNFESRTLTLRMRCSLIQTMDASMGLLMSDLRLLQAVEMPSLAAAKPFLTLSTPAFMALKTPWMPVVFVPHAALMSDLMPLKAGLTMFFQSQVNFSARNLMTCQTRG